MTLNVFQRLMRQWTELWPYNAGVLLHIAGPADLLRWQHSTQKIIEEIGLGAPVFESPSQVRFVSAELPPLALSEDLTQTVNREVNRSFGPEELPIRFFCCPDPAGGHTLGLIFDHWLTDGGTIAECVVRLVVRYANPLAVLRFPAHRLSDQPWEDLFAGKIPSLESSESLREAARVRTEHREVSPLTGPWTNNFETHFLERQWPQGLWEKNKALGQRLGGTGHDLLLAALAKLLAPDDSEISLASVMDIRAEAVLPVTSLFSQFVSFTTHVVEGARSASLEQLTQAIAEKNHRAKTQGKALRNLAALEAARLGWERAGSPQEKSVQFHRLAPLVAGVSHMNVSRLHREIGRSLRGSGAGQSYNECSPLLKATVVSPTGPLTPLLVTVNKLRPESVMMGLSYRTGAYSRLQAEELSDRLVDSLIRATHSTPQ